MLCGHFLTYASKYDKCTKISFSIIANVPTWTAISNEAAYGYQRVTVKQISL